MMPFICRGVDRYDAIVPMLISNRRFLYPMSSAGIVAGDWGGRRKAENHGTLIRLRVGSEHLVYSA